MGPESDTAAVGDAHGEPEFGRRFEPESQRQSEFGRRAEPESGRRAEPVELPEPVLEESDEDLP